ncbi:unnamed protein product [Caenorhabditis brenneri]
MSKSGALCLLLAIGASMVACERPKIKDTHGNLLVKISDIPIGSCGDDSYFGLGIMDGGLEECDRWKKETVDPEYEEYKCKVLRFHAKVKDGKCVCEDKWKGPICNEYHGCQTGETLRAPSGLIGGKPATQQSCTPHMCDHNGTIAVGKKEIECICPPPWDGRLCERLACWRKTIPTQQHRYRNNGDHCICGNHYSGENCDIVKSCLNNGQLIDGKCKCPDHWHGELCDKRCPKGQVTCSTCSSFISGALFTIILVFVNKFNY